MKFFGHELSKHKESTPTANPAEVAAAEAAATIAETPVAEASADFQLPTTESEHIVTDDAVKEAMGAAASLLDTTEAQANGTMDAVPTPTETVSENRYEGIQPMAAGEARVEGEMARSLGDAVDTHSEIIEAEATGELDVAPETPTDGDNAIIDALQLPEAGMMTEEDLISNDKSTPSLGAQVDTLNTLETETILSPEEYQGLPVVTESEIIDDLKLPEAGSAESMAILNEADAVAPATDAEAPVTNEQTPEQQ